jgi:hypothetical protein
MSASIAELESFVSQTRRTRDVAAAVYTRAGERFLQGEGSGLSGEAWALRHAARALATAEEALAEAKARADTDRRQQRNRVTALDILQRCTEGMPKADVLGALHGTHSERRTVLSYLVLEGIAVEYRSERQTFMMLSPECRVSGGARDVATP